MGSLLREIWRLGSGSGRDLFLYLAWRHCGLSHAELGIVAGGIKSGAVSQAVRRMEQRLTTDKSLQKTVDGVRQMLNVEM